jgi:preprotein translocase subunit SecG
MNTVQIVALAVAAAVVLLLIVALLLTRKRGASAAEEAGPPQVERSFLEETPQDTFAVLGKAEQSVEDVTLDPSIDQFLQTSAGSDTGASASGEYSDPLTESGTRASAPAPAEPAEGGQQAAATAAPVSGAGGGMVPLSDIIVTTSSKLVNLHDPDVRRMLTDLVKLEIDQAVEYRRQGQTVDAVMQLNEAEKISTALNLPEAAQRIRAMMDDLQRLT